MTTDLSHFYRPGISLSCIQCDESFGSHALFKTHMDAEHGEPKPYHCDRCDKCYGVRNNLISHIEREHFKKVNFQCPVCHKQFYFKSAWEQHCLTHEQKDAVSIGSDLYRPRKSLKCVECGVLFHSHSDFINHMEVEHDDLTPYHCPNCPKEYQIRDRLILHLKMKHMNRKPIQNSARQSANLSDDFSSLSSETELRDIAVKNANSDAIGKCSEFHQQDEDSTKSYEEHIELSQSSESESFSDAESSKIDMIQNGKQSITKRSDTVSTPELSDNYQKERGIDVFCPGISLLCTYCDVLFESHASFKMHMDQQHGESKPYRCDQCSKCYGDRRHLIKHIECKHLKKVNFECAVCHKRFYNRTNWKKHLFTHQKTGVACIGANLYRPNKSLICAACSVSFHFHFDFINHMNLKHNERSPYRCPKCPKGYQDRRDLIAHLKMKHLKADQIPVSHKQCANITYVHSSLSSEMDFFEDIERTADSELIGQLSELYVEKNVALQEDEAVMQDVESSLSSEFEPLTDAETADILQNKKECKTNGNDAGSILEKGIVGAQYSNHCAMSKDSDKEFLESIQNWDTGECAVCRSTDSEIEHLLLRCDGCDVKYHTLCIGSILVLFELQTFGI